MIVIVIVETAREIVTGPLCRVLSFPDLVPLLWHEIRDCVGCHRGRDERRDRDRGRDDRDRDRDRRDRSRDRDRSFMPGALVPGPCAAVVASKNL